MSAGNLDTINLLWEKERKKLEIGVHNTLSESYSERNTEVSNKKKKEEVSNSWRQK